MLLLFSALSASCAIAQKRSLFYLFKTTLTFDSAKKIVVKVKRVAIAILKLLETSFTKFLQKLLISLINCLHFGDCTSTTIEIRVILPC